MKTNLRSSDTEAASRKPANNKMVDVTPDTLRAAARRLGVKEPRFWGSWMKQLQLPMRLMLVAVAVVVFTPAVHSQTDDTPVLLTAEDSSGHVIRQAQGKLLGSTQVATQCSFLAGADRVRIDVLPLDGASGQVPGYHLAHTSRLIAYNCQPARDSAILALTAAKDSMPLSRIQPDARRLARRLSIENGKGEK